MTLGWQGLRMKRRFALSCKLATSGARAAAMLWVDWHGFMRSSIFGRFAVTGVVETVRPALRITGCKRPRKSSVSQLNILQPERRGGPYGQGQSAVVGWPPLQRCHLRVGGGPPSETARLLPNGPPQILRPPSKRGWNQTQVGSALMQFILYTWWWW